ncbi:hypothetical protein AMAG_19721 [Allomyces macrogynus ATCC 38327]|uniref:Uncharacterized protein n=1 Tax=Allomyces macrogynus (strain ATCC 38327) TaxID=578462 RepID=A0A0L0SZA7_ALLM3|nr:hypothetical protein AMAG_19721 [Allomyces macrogynus ATCC 38327]|eukprot:KNE67888.1 hypothetical protein AMAG_19721 [Allomyces macrogynus ATCC 38327]
MRRGHHRHTASGASANSTTSATSRTSRASGTAPPPPPVPEPAPSTSSSGSTSAAITAAALRKKLLVTALADEDAALGSSSTDVTGTDVHAARSAARSHGWRAKWRRILSLLRVVKKWPRKRQDEWHKSLHAAAVHSLQHSAAHSEDGGVVDGNGPRRIEDGAAAGASRGGQQTEDVAAFGSQSPGATLGAAVAPRNVVIDTPLPPPASPPAAPVTDATRAPVPADDDAPLPPPVVVVPAESATAPVLTTNDLAATTPQTDAPIEEDESLDPPMIHITLDDGFNYEAFTIERAHTVFPRRAQDKVDQSTLDRRRRVRRKSDAPTPEAAALRDKSPLHSMWSAAEEAETVVGHREAGIGAGAAE